MKLSPHALTADARAKDRLYGCQMPHLGGQNAMFRKTKVIYGAGKVTQPMRMSAMTIEPTWLLRRCNNWLRIILRSWRRAGLAILT